MPIAAAALNAGVDVLSAVYEVFFSRLEPKAPILEVELICRFRHGFDATEITIPLSQQKHLTQLRDEVSGNNPLVEGGGNGLPPGK